MRNEMRVGPVLGGLLAAATLVASGCALTSSDPPEAAPPRLSVAGPDADADAAGTGRFAVVAGEIVDPDGNVFVPVGANVGPPLLDSAGQPVWYLTYQGDDITDHLADVEAWGWNTLRLTSSCGGAAATGANAAYGLEEELAAIDRVVDTFTPEGIVVIVDCHSFTGTDPALDSEQHDRIEAFWTGAIERYRDNPDVWFNHLNEFATGREPADIGYWQRVVDDAYSTFASLGADNLLLFDLPDYGQYLEVLRDPAMAAWSQGFCDVVWSWHAYGAIDGVVDPTRPADGEIGALTGPLLEELRAAEVPLLVGEVGYDWNPERRSANSISWEVERDGALAALQYAPALGYGVLVWHANGDSGEAMVYGLKASDSLVFSAPTPDGELSELGSLYWSHSRALAGTDPTPGPPVTGCSRS